MLSKLTAQGRVYNMEKREGGLDDLSVDDILGIKGNRGGLAVYSQANLDSPQNIELHYGKFLKPLKKELVVVVLLNPKLRRIKDVVVSIGDLTRSVIHPREVFMPAIKESAW
ncbi:MAG: JAB domain-containing protein, partial [Nitrospinales bacterium]